MRPRISGCGCLRGFASKAALLFVSVVLRPSSSDKAPRIARTRRHRRWQIRDPNCGVVETFDIEGRVAHGLTPRAVCGAMMRMNCSTYAPIRCPDDCSFLAPSQAFTCFFRCVPAGECGTYNPELAFPNPATRVCSNCAVKSCRSCRSETVCEECHAGFQLRSGGERCAFALDSEWAEALEDLLDVFYLYVFAGVSLGCLALFWVCKYGLHPNRHANLEAIHQAILNRHRVKVQDWNRAPVAGRITCTGIKGLREWYPLTVNVHREDILGVGFSLFYNSLCFLVCISVLFFVVTWAVYRHSSVHLLLKTSDKQLSDDALAGDASPLEVCDDYIPEDVHASLRSFAASNCWAIGFLYVTTFLLSLAYGRYQKGHTKWYDAHNSSMSDYAVILSGLPKDATDESKLSEWFRGELARANSTAFSTRRPTGRPSRVVPAPELEADWLDRKASLEVVGVSICYDYAHRRDVVEKATWQLSDHWASKRADRAFTHEAIVNVDEEPLLVSDFDATNDTQAVPLLSVDRTATSSAQKRASVGDSSSVRSDRIDRGPRALRSASAQTQDDIPKTQQSDRVGLLATECPLQSQALDEDVRAAAEKLFDGPDRLLGTGRAFVVFRHPRDADRVRNCYYENRSFLRHPSAPRQPIKISEVFSEPPTVQWWNMGIGKRVRRIRLVKAVAKVVAAIAVAQLVVMRLYLQHIVLPYARTGSKAGGQKMVVVGTVLSNMNQALCMMIYRSSAELGFTERGKTDAMFFSLNTCLCLVNTAVNLFSMGYLVYSRESADVGIAAFFTMNSLVAVRTENALAEKLYFMVVPGMTFMGYITMPLMMFVMPYCLNIFLMQVIYVWGCLPRGLLHLLKCFLSDAPDSLNVYDRRSAEKGLEPIAIGLPWDYASVIILPSLCFCMLFFVSDFVWRVFLAMFFWACFYYCWCRYMHLRFMKTCFYSTCRLDVCVNYLWGVPLSIIAAAWCVWALRSAGQSAEVLPVYLRIILVAVSFISSLMAWVFCYSVVVKPLDIRIVEDEEQPTVEDVAADRLYTWFNCNPVYVLKCAFYFHDKEGSPIPERRGGHPLACGSDENSVRAYEIGKEYQLLGLRERKRLARAEARGRFVDGDGSVLEFETIFEGAAAMFRRLLSSFCNTVRSSVQPALRANHIVAKSREVARPFMIDDGL